MSEKNIVLSTLHKLNILEDALPQTIEGFTELSKSALQDGIYDGRTKEIMALAISIALFSKGCMKYHLENLMKHDFSYDELMEIISVVIYLSGGTGLMSSMKAIKYYNEINHKGDSKNIDEKKPPAESENTSGHVSFRDNITKGYGDAEK